MYKNMGMFSFSPGKVQCNLIAYLVQFCKGKGHFSPVLHFSYISNYALNISVQLHSISLHCSVGCQQGGAICWCTGDDDDDGDDDDAWWWWRWWPRWALSVGALGTPPVILGSEIVAARIGKPSVLALFLPSSKSSKKYIKIINTFTVFLGGEMTCRLVILRLGKQSQLVITLTSNPIYVISIFIYVFNCISILISSGPRILPNQKDEGNMLLVSISEDASSA